MKLKFLNLKPFFAVLIFFCVTNSVAQKYLPTDWGTGIDGTTCSTTCPNILLGYVDFNYNGSGATPASWNILQVGRYGLVGAANQSLATSVGGYTGTNNMIGGGGYTIVSNPSTIKAGATGNLSNLQNITNNPYADGGFLIIRGDIENAFTYTIRGLQGDGTDQAKYCVRVKIRNVGRQLPNEDNACNEQGDIIKIGISTQGGSYTFSGKYNTLESPCSEFPAGNWNGQYNNNYSVIKRYGDYAVFEGTVTLSGGADNFSISFRPLRADNGATMAIESIEVYGCVPKYTQILDADNNVVGNNVSSYSACATEHLTLRAVSGFVETGEDVVWQKNGVYYGTGNNITISVPAEDVSDVYTASGSLGSYSITIKGLYCCHLIGELVPVFAEHFNYLTEGSNCARLPDNPGPPPYPRIDPRYTYDCPAPNDGHYSVSKTTSNSPGQWYSWPSSFTEHTCYAGGTFGAASEYVNTAACNPTSGMLVVNARQRLSGYDYFYRHTLTGLCDNTYYELSAWYATLAPGSPAKVDMRFGVFMEDADGTVPDDRTPIAYFDTGEMKDETKTVWKEATLSFKTPATGTGRYRLMVNNVTQTTETNGNDIAIDDIVIKKCVPRFGTVEQISHQTSIDICLMNPEPITLIFDAPYSIKERVGNGSNVWVQWAYSDISINGPWTSLGLATINDTIRTITEADYPTGNGAVRYYLAKVSSDYTRVTTLNPLLDICGNDAVSNVFTLRRVIGVDINITPGVDTLRVCFNSPFTITASTSAATEWGWRYGSANGAYITNGGATSSNEAHKTYSKASAQVSDEGKYFFDVKNGDCEAIDSIYVKVLTTAEENTVRYAICDNENYRFQYGGFVDTTFMAGETNSDIYTFFLDNNCGITVHFDLTVNPAFFNEQIVNISDRELPYIWTGHNKTFNASGTYYDSLQTNTTTLCDSIYKLNLIVKQTIRITESSTICQPDVYVFYGKIFNTTTLIVDSLVIGATNDTIFNLDLTVNPTFFYEQTVNISDRELPYIWIGHNKSFYATGTYYDSLQTNTITHCDSIYKLNLIVKQTIRITERDTVCQPDVYVFYGKIFNTTTFIVDSLVIGATNDTIFNLSLWVGQKYFIPINDNICSGPPYNRNGFNIINPQTQIYYDSLFTSLGCDSIRILNLTVNQPIETNINASICSGEIYNQYGFNESVEGTYHIDEITADGCDSTSYLHLSVEVPFSVNDFVITDDLCQGDKAFTFTVPLGTTTNNVNCLINFVPNVGFTPTSATVNQGNNKITVTIPQGTPAGTYEMFISFKEDGANCFAPPTKVTFTIDISIIEQKWDDVIAVLNKKYGGYDFEIYSYQWYKNGEPLSGKNGSYLYTYPEKLDTAAYYYVELVTSEGVVQSCWLYPKVYVPCADCPQFIEVELLPNAQIKTNQPGVASIYNLQGILVGSQKFEAGTTELKITVPKGIYILRIVLKDGYSEVFKFIKN